MLVVESFLPSTEAEEKLRPGDVLMEVAGQVCTDFASLESWLDSHVGSDVAVRLSRAGKMVDASLAVADLHALIPYDFVECAGGVFHQRSYHTCKRYHIPISDQGIFVVQSGFGFGLELPYHAVIVAVAGQQVSSLADFESALAIVADNETFEVSWYNPTTNERRHKRSSVRMERNLWPLCTWRFSALRPNTWERRAVEAAPRAVVPAAAPASALGQAAAQDDEAAEAELGGGEGEGEGEPLAAQDQLGFPPSRDEAIARVQPTVCTVTCRMAHEYATDFIQSEDERGSTLIRRFGVGLIVDVERGLVLTDRYTVPQPLAVVELTFAQIVTTDAVCLFVHPQHNLVLLRYDPAAVRELPVRAVDFSAAGGDGAEAEELNIGEVLHFVSLHGDHRLSAKRVTVGSIYLKAWAFAEPPAYRERNLEICNLNDTLQGLGGLLVPSEGGAGGVRAWFAQFPAGKKHYLAGVPITVLTGLLRPLGLLGGSPGAGPGPAGGIASVTGPAALFDAQVPAIDVEFEELSLAKARRYHGMSLESTRELAASCSDGRRQVLMVSRVTSGGACDGPLAEGDVVLRVGGRPVTRPQEVERLMQQAHPDKNGGAVVWKLLRSKVQQEALVQPSWRRSDGTCRLLVFQGVVLRHTPRAVAERGGPVRAHTRPGQGLYFWYVFPGSPADTFGVAAPGWLVQVDEEPVNTIDELLVAVRAGKFQGREWLRFRAIDSEGRPSVRALHPDGTFWPTVELVRGAADGPAPPRWTRVEHGEG